MKYRHPKLSCVPRIGVLGVAVALVLAVGCSMKGPQKTQLMRQVEHLEVSSNELRVFIRNIEEFMSMTDELNEQIDLAFRAEGIEIAFPQRDLHVRSVRAPFVIEHGDAPATSPDAPATPLDAPEA